ncbi:MFS transporter [Kaistia dalseonensis]|uniref:PPP family 3-phenylpropionic acid transporter n=1 Tax=Kaistia dalseonensis TaxID=410840 RepID=A0ABU0H233_9HYPH|nr:MFS transporter [Kaistia dalseonensis]MCX5493547.1 MFS transporter [Kaistia dalseonensis]MDQ0436107.1 PPP family 3-phenylpropionic acid transporter [Kaistia dalseonensis]
MLAPRFFASRISFYYATYFVVGGLVVPFLPVWLKERGLTAEEIATCLAFPLAARLVFMPLGSWLADRAPNRRFAIIIFGFAALVMFALATIAGGYWPLLVLTGLATTFSSLTNPALDALALTGFRRFGLDYGKMRIWGSISFVVVSLAGGTIFGWFGGPILTPLLLGAYVIAALTAFTLPVTPPAVRKVDDAARPERRSARSLLANPGFLVIIGSSALIQASHCVFYSFGTIHWQELGFSGGEIGMLWAMGVIAEICMFAVAGYAFRIFKPETLIMIGAVAAVIRWALFPFITSFSLSLITQGFHALTFGAAFTGVQLAIARRMPDEITASAQGFWQVLTGVAMAAATLLAGPLYAQFGVWAFPVMSLLALAAIGILMLPILGFVSPTAPVRAD